MQFLKRYKWIIGGVGLAVLVLAFLAFRPDKLFIDDVVDESLEDAFATEAVEESPATTTTSTQAPTTTQPSAGDTTTTTTIPETTTTTEPAGPVAIATGGFFGIDHEAEGTATVYELDGQFVLRFEDDTDIQNGPDLFVWVLETDDYDGGDPGEYIDLGKLKGNVGGQNYELPAEYDPAVHQYVLIWCERFSTPFAAAPLA
jgi:hypothetical protein